MVSRVVIAPGDYPSENNLPGSIKPPAEGIDFSTPVGLVRLIIADTDPDDLVLKDPALLAFLRMEGLSPAEARAADPAADHTRACRLAAANALDSIAASTAQVAQVIRTQDLQLDQTKAAALLQAQARALRTQVDAADAAEISAMAGGVLEFGDY